MLKTIEKRKEKDVQSNVESAGGGEREGGGRVGRRVLDVVGEIADVLSSKMEEEGGRRSERKPGLRKAWYPALRWVD